MEEGNSQDLIQIRVRIEKGLGSRLKNEAKEHKMSLSSYVNFLLSSRSSKEEISYKERISNSDEKKEIESRVYFTRSEAEILKKYSEANGWSTVKEIRYRTISSFAKKPKLNREELKAIYSVRSSINVLGANINRLIRNNQELTDRNINICKELVERIGELKKKISYLEKCNNTSYRLK